MSPFEGRISRAWRAVWPPLATLVFFCLVAEFCSHAGVAPAYLFPPPHAVAESLWFDRAELLTALAATATEACLGLAISFFAGLAIALALSFSQIARRAFYPYAVFFQTVPIISLAPLLVVWFGFGEPTSIAAAFIVSIFPVIASSLAGLESADPALRDLFELYSASSFATLWKLRLPSAAPQIFSGLRIASGLAVIGAIVGEFVGGGGLGGTVDAARTQQRVDKVFAAVVVSSILGLALVSAIDGAGRSILRRWRN